MSGIKEHYYDFTQAGGQVTPDEIDRYERINTGILSISSTWFGTAAAGTSTQAKAFVVINAIPDWPRNALYAVAGSSDMGGTWVLNGKDQFGVATTESVAIGTAANGGTTAGTTIWGTIASGTFTFTTGAIGSGTPKVGVAIGTATTAAFKLGLLTKIAGTSDVKGISWSTQGVNTTVNGGTIGALVDATNHAFTGTSIMAGTESYQVLVKPSYDNSGKANLAKL